MEHLSRPITSWDKTPPQNDVLDLLNRSGTDIAPTGQGVRTNTGTFQMKPYAWTTIAELSRAPATIRALKLAVPREDAHAFGRCRLRITWDHRWHSSIDAPIDLFFGAGHLYNSDDREYLVKGFPSVIRYDGEYVHLSCYWPMPFFRHAKIEVQEREDRTFKNIKWEIRTVDFTDPINDVGYFHATYSDHPEPTLGRDVVFLDTSKVEGGGFWSGNFVGMSWIFTRNGYLPTLEGDPRFFFDGSRTPQAWGTGTEDEQKGGQR